MTGTYRRSGGLAVLVAAAAIGLAACSGSSSPQVASLGTSSGNGSGSSTSSGNGSGSSTAAPPTGNPTQLLDEWASCMRSHGDTGQADPVIDADKVIHIVISPVVPGGFNGTNKGGQGNVGPGQYCRTYLTDASTALRGGQPAPKPPGEAALVKYAECMRANGVPDFPDPTGNGLSISRNAGGDLNPSNPAFQNASKVCTKKTGVQTPGVGGTLPPGTVTIDGEPGPNG